MDIKVLHRLCHHNRTDEQVANVGVSVTLSKVEELRDIMATACCPHPAW